VQVRDVIGGIVAGVLTDMRLDTPEAQDSRLRNDQEIRALVLQIGECGRAGWEYARAHTRATLKAEPGTPEPRSYGNEDSENGRDDDDDDEDWPAT
jgi:hypothetical protein